MNNLKKKKDAPCGIGIYSVQSQAASPSAEAIEESKRLGGGLAAPGRWRYATRQREEGGATRDADLV